MRYWWVNQNQTFAQEFKGGYLWSPKRKSNGAINPYYEFMREVAPGDLVFCFEDTRIRALGIAQSEAYQAPKPEEFGSAGPNWGDIGWKVEVRYFELKEQIRPAAFMSLLAPLLPERYSPLQPNGRGNQAVYLTTVNERLAIALTGLIGHEARDLLQVGVREERELQIEKAAPDILRWEDHIAEVIKANKSLPETEREALILARRGQGTFKRNVSQIESRCRVTGVYKPWERVGVRSNLVTSPPFDYVLPWLSGSSEWRGLDYF